MCACAESVFLLDGFNTSRVSRDNLCVLSKCFQEQCAHTVAEKLLLMLVAGTYMKDRGDNQKEARPSPTHVVSNFA